MQFYNFPHTTPYLARPYHTSCDARQAIAYTLSWPPGHTIYHAVPTRPYHTPCHALPCHAIYHAMPRQTLSYTILCPPGHTICHAMPTRPYRITCHTRQAIPLSGHTIYYAARQAIPFPMPCPPDHTIYHAMPRQAITYTMPWIPGHTIYLTMPARSYHIPCHVMPNNCFGKSCHLSKGANGLVTWCTIACKY